jgi:hypothetical protein
MPLLSVAYFSLLALVAVTPVLLFFDNLIVAGAIQLYAAVGMTLVAVGMRPGEAQHFFKLIRVPAALAALPLIWMLIQLLPLPIGGLSGSIWQSAASALDTPLSSSVSIDPGLTLIALCRLASLAAVAFVAAAVSIERQRAETLLLVLATAAAVMSLALLASQVGQSSLLDASGAGATTGISMTAGIIGIILFVAGAIMIVERYEIGRHSHGLLSQLLLPISIPIAGLIVCSLTLIASDTSYAKFAAACGVATVVIIYLVRRIGFGPRAGLAVGTVAIAAAVVIIWTNGHPIAGDLTSRYMTNATADVVARDTRMVDAVGLGGSGAGTFGALSILYGAQQPPNAVAPSTFAAKIAVELGRPALWFIVGLAWALGLLCAWGAFNRGRDFFYPLAAAGVTVTMVLSSFSDTGLTNLAISLLVAITLGLGLGQTVGRTLSSL